MPKRHRAHRRSCYFVLVFTKSERRILRSVFSAPGIFLTAAGQRSDGQPASMNGRIRRVYAQTSRGIARRFTSNFNRRVCRSWACLDDRVDFDRRQHVMERMQSRKMRLSWRLLPWLQSERLIGMIFASLHQAYSRRDQHSRSLSCILSTVDVNAVVVAIPPRSD